MSKETTHLKDNWAADNYVANAAFVPKLASIIVDDFLQPSATDTVLDIGCGDGALTAKLAAEVRYVHGVDSSASLLGIAREKHGLDVALVNAREISAAKLKYPEGEQKYDKVFSNAALHWILCTNHTFGDCDGDTIRQRFFDEVYRALKPNGGVFAAEFGGLGNVSEIHAAFVSTLVRHGLTPQEARLASPWYFPHEDSVRTYLERAGFHVDRAERVYRSTLLPHGEEGMLEWLELFGFAFIEALENKNGGEGVVDRKGFFKEVLEVLRGVAFDADSGNWYAGYVRLRFRATKN